MIALFKRLFGLRKPPLPRQLVFIEYSAADRMLKENAGWRIAPEEDRNRSIGWVWLERDVPSASEQR